jgi:hypothetical protein
MIPVRSPGFQGVGAMAVPDREDANLDGQVLRHL